MDVLEAWEANNRERARVMDYVKFYHLERYLFEEVGPKFRSLGTISSS